MDKKQAWRALQDFYKLKSLLLPEFIRRNKRTINLLEAKLAEQYEKAGDVVSEALKANEKRPRAEGYTRLIVDRDKGKTL